MTHIHETFTAPTLPSNFYWFNPPQTFQIDSGLEIVTKAKTDFWQRSHYGFQRDDGHCLFTRLTGDFSIQTHVTFEPQTQYDQCGLMIRLDADNWIKTSVEYEDDTVSRLGSVVTNLGYSDWATQDIASTTRELHYRISKRGSDFLIESAFDGATWQQLRIAHLHQTAPQLEAGVYACSPIGTAFRCKFLTITVSENEWSYDS